MVARSFPEWVRNGRNVVLGSLIVLAVTGLVVILDTRFDDQAREFFQTMTIFTVVSLVMVGVGHLIIRHRHSDR